MSESLHHDPSPPARFYWELPARERDEARLASLEDEGYLAHDLNYGRRILEVVYPYEPCAEVMNDSVSGMTPEAISDALAALLQAAAWAGFDPSDMCRRALATRRGVYSMSAAAAGDRVRRQASYDRGAAGS